MSIDTNLLTAKDFIGVRAEVIRQLGGDANRAVVLTRIFYRAAQDYRESVEVDGAFWWRATREQIAEETGLSPDQVKRIITWLAAEGFIEAVSHHLEGKWDQTRSLRVTTDQAESPDHRAESPDIGADSHRSIGADSPNVIGADSPNPPIKTLKTEKTYVLFDGSKITEGDLVTAFEIWWKTYPRKVNKPAALKAFRVAVTKATLETLSLGAIAYQRSNLEADPRFVAHPASWLNGERWNDEERPAGSGRDSIRSL